MLDRSKSGPFKRCKAKGREEPPTLLGACPRRHPSSSPDLCATDGVAEDPMGAFEPDALPGLVHQGATGCM